MIFMCPKTFSKDILHEYVPQEYLREIVQAKNSSGMLFLYYALLADLKPMLDDWVPAENMHLFEKACRKYGLFVYKESLFVDMPSLDIEKTIGKESLTTTKVFNAPINSKYPGYIHVFVSRSKEILKEGRGYGGYGLVINARAIHKLMIDHYLFGTFLGYPKCCIDFFWKYNNHKKYANTLFIPFKNTKKPNFLCNCLTKDTHSYLYHIPCSFDCKKTIHLASELRKFIYEKDSRYGQLIDKCMKQTFLVFKERDIYCFDGQFAGDKFTYSNCYFQDYMLYQPKYLELFHNGNSLKVTDENIIIYFNNTFIAKIKKNSPEEGFIISFSD